MCPFLGCGDGVGGMRRPPRARAACGLREARGFSWSRLDDSSTVLWRSEAPWGTRLDLLCLANASDCCWTHAPGTSHRREFTAVSALQEHHSCPDKELLAESRVAWRTIAKKCHSPLLGSRGASRRVDAINHGCRPLHHSGGPDWPGLGPRPPSRDASEAYDAPSKKTRLHPWSNKRPGLRENI